VNVDVTLEGRPWKVTVEPADEPGQFAVTIKGTRRLVSASWIDADTLSLVDGGIAREVRVHHRQDGSIAVEVNGRVFETLVSAGSDREAASDRPAAATPAGPASVHSVKAPMPGRVVRVLVAAGDRVTARQGLVVVEAMKMENELRATREGTVREVLVAAGTAVETGAVLVVIEH
jgi:biotin carboxyl carrier protein